MLQFENLLFAVAIIVGAYAWCRTGFRTPRVLRLSARVTRRAVVVVGWALILGIVVRSIGALVGDGRIPVSQSGQYAYRSREPGRFWGEIAGEILLVGGMGACLIHMGRTPAPTVPAA